MIMFKKLQDIKRNVVLTVASTQMNLENILSEVSHT